MNRQRGVRIGLSALRKFFAEVREGLGLAETELVICFVTDAEIARMNLAFRKKRGPTDVLSFPAQVRRKALKITLPSDGRNIPGRRAGAARRVGPGEREYLGDIAISPATAQRNAKRFGRSLPAELRVLMLHGVLHLLGYDHESDRGEMNRLEAKLRRRFGLA